MQMVMNYKLWQIFNVQGEQMKVDDTNKTDSFAIFKFGEKRWIEQFRDGHFNFSCVEIS